MSNNTLRAWLQDPVRIYYMERGDDRRASCVSLRDAIAWTKDQLTAHTALPYKIEQMNPQGRYVPVWKFDAECKGVTLREVLDSLDQVLGPRRVA